MRDKFSSLSFIVLFFLFLKKKDTKKDTVELVQATSTILSIFSKKFYQEPKNFYQEIPREILPIPIEYTLEVIIDIEKKNFLLTFFLLQRFFFGVSEDFDPIHF